jgi:hypothetical protein
MRDRSGHRQRLYPSGPVCLPDLRIPKLKLTHRPPFRLPPPDSCREVPTVGSCSNLRGEWLEDPSRSGREANIVGLYCATVHELNSTGNLIFFQQKTAFVMVLALRLEPFEQYFGPWRPHSISDSFFSGQAPVSLSRSHF